MAMYSRADHLTCRTFRAAGCKRLTLHETPCELEVHQSVSKYAYAGRTAPILQDAFRYISISLLCASNACFKSCLRCHNEGTSHSWSIPCLAAFVPTPYLTSRLFHPYRLPI
eukprot:2914872-Pleurochrysis_carterae.AAC.1